MHTTAVTPYEAAVRLGWSDSVHSLPAHTRRLNPRAVTARGIYVAIDLDVLAGPATARPVEQSRILEYGVLD